MRYQSERISWIIFRDSTKALQLWGAVASWMVGLYVIRINLWSVNYRAAAAFFYLLPEWAWALICLVLGGIQWWAAGTRRWWVKYRVALAQMFLMIYASVCYFLSGTIGLGTVLLATFAGIQVHIAMRAHHDRELNGADWRS